MTSTNKQKRSVTINLNLEDMPIDTIIKTLTNIKEDSLVKGITNLRLETDTDINHHVYLFLSGERDETDEERDSRVANEVARQKIREDAELSEYERLKRKFEPEKTNS